MPTPSSAWPRCIPGTPRAGEPIRLRHPQLAAARRGEASSHACTGAKLPRGTRGLCSDGGARGGRTPQSPVCFRGRLRGCSCSRQATATAASHDTALGAARAMRDPEKAKETVATWAGRATTAQPPWATPAALVWDTGCSARRPQPHQCPPYCTPSSSQTRRRRRPPKPGTWAGASSSAQQRRNRRSVPSRTRSRSPSSGFGGQRRGRGC